MTWSGCSYVRVPGPRLVSNGSTLSVSSRQYLGYHSIRYIANIEVSHLWCCKRARVIVARRFNSISRWVGGNVISCANGQDRL